MQTTGQVFSLRQEGILHLLSGQGTEKTYQSLALTLCSSRGRTVEGLIYGRIGIAVDEADCDATAPSIVGYGPSKGLCEAVEGSNTHYMVM